MNNPVGQIDFQSELSDRLTVHKNIGQDIIVITMDKIRLCLLGHRDAIARKNEWVTPLGLLLSFGTTLVAADFKDFVLKKSVWTALFVMATMLCTLWLIRAAFSAWKHRNAGDVETIVRELAAQNATTP